MEHDSVGERGRCETPRNDDAERHRVQRKEREYESMRKERRWMTSVVREAAKTKLDMPWTRGTRRDAFIAKRARQSAQRTARA